MARYVVSSAAVPVPGNSTTSRAVHPRCPQPREDVPPLRRTGTRGSRTPPRGNRPSSQGRGRHPPRARPVRQPSVTWSSPRSRQPASPELVRVCARPSCGALLLHPSCFCPHTRCLFSNISPTEGRGCCGNCCRLPPTQFPSLASLQVTTIPRVQGDPLLEIALLSCASTDSTQKLTSTFQQQPQCR